MSLKLFDGFRFTRRDTPVHRMDPRAKLILVATFFVGAVIFSNLLVLLAIFLVEIPVIASARSLRRWVRTMRGGAAFALLIFFMNLFFGGTLSLAIALTLRFIILLSSFSIFFLTTSPDDFGLALQQAHLPYTLSFTFTTAVRLIPTMAIDVQTIVDAQKSRGLELEKGNLLRRIRNYIPILIPLIISAIRRSVELAEALESRAFGAKKTRSSMVTLRMSGSDYFAVALTTVFLGVMVYLYLFSAVPSFEIPIKIPSLLQLF